MQSELGKPTFSSVGKESAGHVSANLTVDRVQVDLAGMAHVLDKKAEQLKALTDIVQVLDENLQSLCEGAVAIVHSLDKINPTVNIKVPEQVYPAPVSNVTAPVTVNITAPWYMYALLALNLGILCLILAKSFQG